MHVADELSDAAFQLAGWIYRVAPRRALSLSVIRALHLKVLALQAITGVEGLDRNQTYIR